MKTNILGGWPSTTTAVGRNKQGGTPTALRIVTLLLTVDTLTVDKTQSVFTRKYGIPHFLILYVCVYVYTTLYG